MYNFRPSTPAGTKLKIISPVSVVNGFLLLTPKNVQFLGGHVEHMAKKWNLQKVTRKLNLSNITNHLIRILLIDVLTISAGIVFIREAGGVRHTGFITKNWNNQLLYQYKI